MEIKGVVDRAAIEEKVMGTAVDLGRWYRWQVFIRDRAPEVESIIPCDVEIFQEVTEAMVVLFVGACTVLGGADDGVRDVGAACNHGVDAFTNAIAIAKSHLVCKSFLHLRVGVAFCT